MRALKLFGVFILFFMIAMPFLGSDDKPKVTETSVDAQQQNPVNEQQQALIKQQAQIAEQELKNKAIQRASSPFEKHAYPKLYDKFGETGMQQINDLLPVVAKSISDSHGCDIIDDIGISSESNDVNPIFYASCLNGNRFITSKIEIQSGKLPELQRK